jgi:small redox-active disulfide protein 2
MKVEVLGSGCPTCKNLHEIVVKIVKENNIDAEVEYSTDITRIVELGIMYSPVLVIDGKPANIRNFDKESIKNVLLGKTNESEGCGSCSCGGNC